MSELGLAIEPGIILNNNEGAIALVKNWQVGQQTKHIDICHHFIRDTREQGQMEIKFVGTAENEADICTKNLDCANHEQIRDHLQNGTMKVWIDYKSLIASMHWREDVKKQDRVTLLVQSIEESIKELNDLNEDTDDETFNKRMKISW